MIIRATEKDLIKAVFVYQACIPEMNYRGLYNWNYAYPSPKLIEEDILKGELFIYLENYICLAAVCLNEEQPEEYKSLSWNYGERFIVVHRLGVHPEFRNMKIGEKIMQFAEDFARQNNYDSIRLDAITANPAAIRLYEKMGYEKKGSIFFSYQKDSFMCMEKMF
jgi:ribosomal protein S18 acetylase RimI-like enzyme